MNVSPPNGDRQLLNRGNQVQIAGFAKLLLKWYKSVLIVIRPTLSSVDAEGIMSSHKYSEPFASLSAHQTETSRRAHRGRSEVIRRPNEWNI